MPISRWNDATHTTQLVAQILLAGLIASACSAQPVQTQRSGNTELVDLINAWRQRSPDCDGKRLAPSPALATNPVLASTSVAASQRPIDALKLRGYLASHVETVFVTGPSRTSDVMRFLIQKYCKVLGGNEASEIGIERSGDTWHIVLARPLMASDLGDWRKAGLDVLRQANAARATARMCGDRRVAAAPPLAWNDTLAAAALAHGEDMARRDVLSHAGGDGSNSGDRATRIGYRWRIAGENIASGQGSARLVVESWLQPRSLRDIDGSPLYRNGRGLRDEAQQSRNDLLGPGIRRAAIGAAVYSPHITVPSPSHFCAIIDWYVTISLPIR